MNNELSIDADKSEISLDDSKSDRAVVALKGALGAVPVVGSILSEVVGVVIPNQKADRIKLFVEVFAEKVKHIEKDVLDVKMKTENFTDLFEDALPQAARALTDERREYIANFLKNSLTSDEVDHTREKRLLSLLNELNDVEIIGLKIFALEAEVKLFGSKKDIERLQAFEDKHEDVFVPSRVENREFREVNEEIEFTRSYMNNLESLGLIVETYSENSENPVFNTSTGKLFGLGKKITPIGRMLLRYIDDDFIEY
jgi:hypothetical protein